MSDAELAYQIYEDNKSFFLKYTTTLEGIELIRIILNERESVLNTLEKIKQWPTITDEEVEELLK